MRRRLEMLIPIVMLAIMVQLLAPIGAFRAVAYASSDPLYMASICSEMTHSSDAQTPDSPQHPHGDCCAFCVGTHHAGVVVLPPSPVFVTLQLQFQRVRWLQPIEYEPTVRAGSNSQARAPPLFS